MRKLPARRVSRIAALFTLGILAACGETGINAPIAVGGITPVGGATRTGVAGQPLPALVEVIVLGTDNQPLPRAQVVFAASGTGAVVDPATAITDANGIARTRWTLTSQAGPSTLTATSGSISATIAANGTAGAAASVTATAGNNQVGVAGAALAVAPTVRVVDANGNPVSGAAVTFLVLTGGGTLTDFVRTTNTQGLATLGSWVLGPIAGTQTLAARVEQGGVANNPVLFTATANAAGAALATAVSPTSQTGAVGSAVVPPSVRVTDVNGNPVANVTVTFAPTAGGGTVTGGSRVTNAQGIATALGWNLGTTVGLNQVTATVPGAGNVIFSATATAGAATQLTIVSGNNQNAQINRAVAFPPTVVARDALGNPVPGVIVTFTVTSGGGTVISGRQTTDATGTASAGAWFLGPTPGTNTLTASAPGITPVTFTATATPGQPVSMVPNSAIIQTGVVALPVSDPPSVVVRDVSGNPVPGVIVTFTITAGNGTVTGSPDTTNAAGVAILTAWTLGPTVTTNTVVASSPGLPNVTFSATPAAGAAANVAVFAGDNGTAVQGTPLVTRPAVRVTDAQGNAVPNATVTFAVTAGGGAVTGANQTTDATGVATVGSWILGSGAPNTLSATVTGTNIVGNPVTFNAQSATAIALTAVPPGPLTLGQNFSITVQLRDSNGQPVALSGVPLTLSIASGGGTLNGTALVATAANGVATFTVNVTGAAGARTFTVSGTGLSSATTGAITFN